MRIIFQNFLYTIVEDRYSISRLSAFHHYNAILIPLEKTLICILNSDIELKSLKCTKNVEKIICIIMVLDCIMICALYQNLK